MAKKTETDKPVTARVLLRTHAQGAVYEPNTLLTASPEIVKLLESHGFLDSNGAAVAYVESLAAA